MSRTGRHAQKRTFGFRPNPAVEAGRRRSQSGRSWVRHSETQARTLAAGVLALTRRSEAGKPQPMMSLDAIKSSVPVELIDATSTLGTSCCKTLTLSDSPVSGRQAA